MKKDNSNLFLIFWSAWILCMGLMIGIHYPTNTQKQIYFIEGATFGMHKVDGIWTKALGQATPTPYPTPDDITFSDGQKYELGIGK